MDFAVFTSHLWQSVVFTFLCFVIRELAVWPCDGCMDGCHVDVPCRGAADSGGWHACQPLANRSGQLAYYSLTALLGRWWPARLTDERAGAQPVASSRARPRYFVLFKPYMVLCSWEADGSKNGRAPRTTLADLGLPSGVHNVGRLDRVTARACCC